MTQSERLLQFVQKQNERDIRKAPILIRIDNGELVITHHWPLSHLTQLGVNVPADASPPACKRDWRDF